MSEGWPLAVVSVMASLRKHALDRCRPFQGQLLSALESHLEVLGLIGLQLGTIRQTFSLEKNKDAFSAFPAKTAGAY